MTTLTAREIIKKEYGDSKNFMTPSILETKKISINRAYELSSGEAFLSDGRIYGVSVVDYDPATDTTQRNYDLSEMFHSYQEAKEHIKALKQEARSESV